MLSRGWRIAHHGSRRPEQGLCTVCFGGGGGGGGGAKTTRVQNVKVAITALSVFITIRPASRKDHLFIEIISFHVFGKIHGFLVFWSNMTSGLKILNYSNNIYRTPS